MHAREYRRDEQARLHAPTTAHAQEQGQGESPALGRASVRVCMGTHVMGRDAHLRCIRACAQQIRILDQVEWQRREVVSATDHERQPHGMDKERGVD